MSYSQRQFETLAAEAKRLGRALTKTEWITFSERFYAAEHAKPKKTSPGISKMTEAEFVAWLEGKPHLAGVDVKKEIGRCAFYCEAKGQGAPSRQRIVNWLNKTDKPIVGNYAGASSASRAAADKRKDPPHGWREFMKQKIREWEEANPNGGDAPGKSALAVYDDFYRMPGSWQAAAWKELAP